MTTSQSKELLRLFTLLESLQESHQIKYRIESLNVVIDNKLSNHAFEVEIKSINHDSPAVFQGDTLLEALSGAYSVYLKKQSTFYQAKQSVAIKSFMQEVKKTG